MTSPVSYGLALSTRLRVLAVTYRSAKTRASSFPAQLLDALAGYMHLLKHGFSPENILIAGDSAGAFASLALMRYLGDLKDLGPCGMDLGMVGAATLISVGSYSLVLFRSYH
jgi:acetyl esterase/lipase